MSPILIEGMVQDQSKASSPIPQQRLSFRSHISNKQTQMQIERNKTKILRSGYGYMDKSLWLRPKPCKQEDKHGQNYVGVVPIHPEYLSEADTCSVDPARIPDAEIESSCTSDIPDLTRVNPEPIETIAPISLPLPISPNSLFHNLLSLISRPEGPLHLQSLLSYYLRPHCRTFHSTKSFNLLISYAIRHASFKTADYLLSQMTAEGIKGNLETWKLRVRLMVRCGEWNLAWRSVMRILAQEGWQEQMGVQSDYGGGMPLAIWIEFMSTSKRGAFRGPIRHGIQEVDEGYSPEGNNQEDDHKEELSKKRKMEASKALDSQRLQLLMTHTPSLAATDYTRIPARIVYFMVWMMLRAGHFRDARNMTRSYLAGLPPRLGPSTIRALLDIIHLHIPWGFRSGNALREYQSVRSTVEEFFALHRDIRPDGRTLFLLLRSFRRTKFSGTLARQAANDFCRKWGYRTESRYVRERITVFAINEGNIALAESELRKEMQSRFQEWTYAAQTEVLGGTGRAGYPRLLRQSMRKIYKGHGVDKMRWRYLTQKARRMKKLISKNRRIWRAWRRRSRWRRQRIRKASGVD